MERIKKKDKKEEEKLSFRNLQFGNIKMADIFPDVS